MTNSRDQYPFYEVDIYKFVGITAFHGYNEHNDNIKTNYSRLLFLLGVS